MSRGRRYNNEPKLNMKKVVAVILIIVVMIVFIIAIKKLIGQESTKTIATKSYFSLYSNDKWGVIDSQANIVIEPTYEEMIIIPDNTKAPPYNACTDPHRNKMQDNRTMPPARCLLPHPAGSSRHKDFSRSL